MDVGQGPLGARQIYDVAGGTFEGPKLRGTILPSGGDWLQVGSDGIGRLDVRATFATDDGAHIYMQYFGVADFAAVTEKLARGEATDFGEIYFMTTPPGSRPETPATPGSMASLLLPRAALAVSGSSTAYISSSTVNCPRNSGGPSNAICER